MDAADDKKSFDWGKFRIFLKKVIEFKSRISFIYINADSWEESIYFALKKMGENPDWQLGSHAKGADVKTTKFAISAKSGSVRNGDLTISSYRLTRYKTIAEMTDFINKEINYDFYLCCARRETTNGGREYGIFKINSSVFRPKIQDWQEAKNKNGERSGWVCKLMNGVGGRIVFNMSNQLWLDIPLNLCEKLFSVEFTRTQLGADLERIFE